MLNVWILGGGLIIFSLTVFVQFSNLYLCLLKIKLQIYCQVVFPQYHVTESSPLYMVYL